MPDLVSLSAHSGISVPVLETIIAAGRKYAQRIVLYGSRARGDYHPLSDIDLAFFGSREGYDAFADAMEELPSLLKVDLVLVARDINADFFSNIKKDGVSLMDKAFDRADQFSRALSRLAETATLYRDNSQDSIIRDALIQRFEFTYEVAWKSLKDYLNELGIVDVRSPRNAIQEAFAQKLITADHEQEWLDIIKARNLTTHMYDEALITQIAEDIVTRYLDAFTATLSLLKQEGSQNYVSGRE